MIEPEPVKKLSRKEQISFDEQKARRLQAQCDEEERIAKEESLKVEEANITLTEEWNNIQAKIDVDYEMAQRLPNTSFVQLLEARKKHFAAKRAEEKRNKPPTQAQQRKIMVNTFVDMDTEVVEGSSKRAGEAVEHESTKKQKADEDKSTVELQSLMEVIHVEEEAAIDVIPLATKPPKNC
ncbi:hypothetical protein Tco_1314009 [Tanacetum coccineum]